MIAYDEGNRYMLLSQDDKFLLLKIFKFRHRPSEMSIKNICFSFARRNGMHLISLEVIEIVLCPKNLKNSCNYCQYRQDNGCGFLTNDDSKLIRRKIMPIILFWNSIISSRESVEFHFMKRNTHGVLHNDHHHNK